METAVDYEMSNVHADPLLSTRTLLKNINFTSYRLYVLYVVKCTILKRGGG